MGWEPRTSYEYDDAGRLISSSPEVEWDETEQNWMLALQDYRDSLCPLCGGPTEICQSSDLNVVNSIRARHPVRCNVTTVVDIAQNADGADKYPQPRALLWGAEIT